MFEKSSRPTKDKEKPVVERNNKKDVALGEKLVQRFSNFSKFLDMGPLFRDLNTHGPLLRALYQNSSEDQKKMITLKLPLI